MYAIRNDKKKVREFSPIDGAVCSDKALPRSHTKCDPKINLILIITTGRIRCAPCEMDEMALSKIIYFEIRMGRKESYRYSVEWTGMRLS